MGNQEISIETILTSHTAALRRGAMSAVQSKELLMKQVLLLMKCERLRLRHTHGNRKNKGIEEEIILPYPRKQKKKEETWKRFPISNINSIFGLLTTTDKKVIIPNQQLPTWMMDSMQGHLRPSVLNECEARIYYCYAEQLSGSGPGMEPSSVKKAGWAWICTVFRMTLPLR